MDRNKLIFFLAIGGHLTATTFTQLMYWSHGYMTVWREVNPVLHIAFMNNMPWLHLVHSAIIVVMLLASYLATKARSLKIRAFATPWLYGLAAGFLLNAINDAHTYLTLTSLPFEWAIAAVAAGGVVGAISLIPEIVKERKTYTNEHDIDKRRCSAYCW